MAGTLQTKPSSQLQQFDFNRFKIANVLYSNNDTKEIIPGPLLVMPYARSNSRSTSIRKVTCVLRFLGLTLQVIFLQELKVEILGETREFYHLSLVGHRTSFRIPITFLCPNDTKSSIGQTKGAEAGNPFPAF